MRIVPAVLLLAVSIGLGACVVVSTAASVTGSVVSTTVGVTGDVIGGVSRTVTGSGRDEDEKR